jgi:hypothetical protein
MQPEHLHVLLSVAFVSSRSGHQALSRPVLSGGRRDYGLWFAPPAFAYRSLVSDAERTAAEF